MSSGGWSPPPPRCVMPGFHPNAIACVTCVAFGWKPMETVLSPVAVATTGARTAMTDRYITTVDHRHVDERGSI